VTDASSSEAWRFPIGALVAATLSAFGAGAAMLLWMLVSGMGHGARTPRVDIIWYVGIALMLGAAWLFWDAGGDIGRAPSAERTMDLLIYTVLAYFLCAACGAIGAWALAMIVLF
jgi:hypothetical protein